MTRSNQFSSGSYVRIPLPARAGGPASGKNPGGPRNELAPWAPLGTAVLAGAWVLVAAIHVTEGPEARIATWHLSYLFLEVLACLSLALRGSLARGPGRVAWWLLAASNFLDVPNLALSYLHVHGHSFRGAEHLFNGMNLGTGLLALAGILAFPRGPERRRQGRQPVLDSLLFATSLLFLLWVMGIQGSLRGAAQGVGLRVFIAYLNVALLGGGLVYSTSNQADRSRGPLGWLAASVVAWMAVLSCWAWSGLPSVIATRPWMVLAGGIPLFQGLAAWAALPVPGYLPGSTRERNLAKLLPYLPLIAGLAVLTGFQVFAPSQIPWQTFGIFLVMVILLLLRMFQAIRELQAARSQLEERVQARTLDLERAQETLLRTERMNTQATLGAGMAHDLNNLLGIIRNYAQLVREEALEGNPPGERNLGRILEASEKAGRLTQRLMAFGRRESASQDTPPEDLAALVESTLEILAMLLPRNIGLEFRACQAPCPVKVERHVLEQVLVNLVSNAKDAMPQGGRVSLALDRSVRGGGREAAVLAISDTGHGIPPEMRDLVFEAFFTTKPEGRGTGLGLASVRSLMEAQGGMVEVDSDPGQGTTFRLVFPLCPGEGVPAEP